MKLEINNVIMHYVNGALSHVEVHFNSYDEDRSRNTNGYLPLTAEEYNGNEPIESLKTLVRNSVSESILEAE